MFLQSCLPFASLNGIVFQMIVTDIDTDIRKSVSAPATFLRILRGGRKFLSERSLMHSTLVGEMLLPEQFLFR